MDSVLIVLLRQIVVPELSRFIQNYYNEKGKLPTKEELEAEVVRNADKIVAEGLAFLERIKNEHPKPGTN